MVQPERVFSSILSIGFFDPTTIVDSTPSSTTEMTPLSGPATTADQLPSRISRGQLRGKVVTHYTYMSR
jgi:hypothetical protein